MHDGSAPVGGPLLVEHPAQPALDMHEGIGTPRALGGCSRWPANLRLLASDGRLVPGRCRATNLCTYCATLYAVETAEVLTRDALGGNAPTLWLVLTAREHLTRADCREHLRKLRRALRRRWPAVEWFVQVEFQRRGALHLNLLIKGVPAADADELRTRAVSLWCSRVDAEPVGQWLEPIDAAELVTSYISKLVVHGLKSTQRPPIGWRGHRTSSTRGYFNAPMWKLRREAREALQERRELHKAFEAGYVGVDAEVEVAGELARARRRRWQLVAIAVDETTGELVRVRPANGRDDLVTAPTRAGRDFAADEFVALVLRELDALELTDDVLPTPLHEQLAIGARGP